MVQNKFPQFLLRAALKSLKGNLAYLCVSKSLQWLDNYFFCNYTYIPILQGQISLLNALCLCIYVSIHNLDVVCVEFFDGICSMFL